MKFHILTLFPDMFRGFVDDSILKRAQEKGLIDISTDDIREYSTDKHRKVDDTIYGGGAGMLLRPEPVAAAIRAAKAKLPESRVIYLSPSGERFTQQKAEELAASNEDLIILSGRYEGVDQRIRALLVDEELSIGDYVLSGGEIAAAAIVDVVARLVPGVVGKEASITTESFSRELFRCAEFPQFTRPEVWEGLSVPDVLLSGNHAAIENWQLDHLAGLSDSERKMLAVRRLMFPHKTKRTILRMHHESDIEYWVKWLNDHEVVKWTSISPPLSYEDEREFFDDTQANLDCLPISICDRKTKQPIGVTSLERDPLNNKSAAFGIIIGDKSFWKKGFGREVLRAMLTIGFEELGLERIHLDVFVDNQAAIDCYEACGLLRVGLERKKFLKTDGFHDTFLYEILKEDFLKKS